MTELFNGIIYTFGSSSALTAVIQYEKRRSGANMQYRFYYKIYISDRNKNPNPYGSYQNNLRIIFNLNGGDVLTRNIKSSSSGWSFEYTSDWFSVAKTTGTTPFKFTIKDTQNSSWCNYSSTTYNLTVDPAGSDLQTIPNFNIGTSFNVSITKYADMYDVLSIKIGSTTIKTINNASTTNPITFNSSELNTIYGLTVNDASKDFTFELKTFENSSSSTQVGTTKTKIAKGYIVASNPTINSLTAIDTNQNCIDLTGSNTKMVLGVSNVKVTVNASGVNKATIKSITVNNVTASNGIVTFNEATVNTFNVIVTDSRGFQTTNSITLQTINYILLTLSANVKRNQPTDGKVVISYSGNYFNGSFGDISNTLTIQYRYIEKGGSWDNVPWIDLTPTITNNTYSQSLTIEGFDYQKQYIFEIIAKDELEEIYLSNIVLTKGYPIINWEDDFFNVNVDLTIKDDKSLKSGKFFDDTALDSFQSSIFGSNNNGYRTKAIRSAISGNNDYPQYASGIAFTGNDTHGFLLAKYDKPDFIVGGGNANEIKWVKHVAFTENAIVESGSNSNGTYIKFGNGIMVCFGSFDVNTNISNTWGVLYSSDIENVATFPKTFTNIYSCNLTTIGEYGAIINRIKYSTSRITLLSLSRPNVQSATFNFDYIAWGTWE